MAQCTTRFLIADTLVSDNFGPGLFFGIQVFPQGTGSALGTLDHVLMNKNGIGIDVDGGATRGVADVTSVESMATNNIIGFGVQRSGILRLAHSVVTGNSQGVNVASTAVSSGDNFINGNGTNVIGTLTEVGTQ